ncbi:MAG: sulfotransferase domain-containing protein [Coleofasciculus sp. G1-WW12-02]|uniref:sulfotransferase domain-containing protein n=1 Tax=Coleofasciculus sp. G1-WW12-02 TaxID=3068483 RepID=UPI0033019D44
MVDNFNQTSSVSTTSAAKDDSRLNYVFILSAGRSGTTWLAQILNTYEHCSYKHEPFNPSRLTPYKQWLIDLESGDAIELRRRFESIVERSYPGIDLQPFPEKSIWQGNRLLLRLFHGLGRRVDALQFLYEWYGHWQLTEQTPVLIKDVVFPNHLLSRLCEVLLQPYMLVIVRNPFAVVASDLKFLASKGLSKPTSKRIAGVRQQLDTPVGKYLSHYKEQLEDMSAAQLNAVYWRVRVEPLVEFAQTYGKGLVVVYENLCVDPLGKTSEIFNFVGWELSQSTHDFIKTSISGERQSSNSRYSVYRDPRTSMSKWKTQLTAEQKADIASVIRESPLKDLWSDLPL